MYVRNSKTLALIFAAALLPAAGQALDGGPTEAAQARIEAADVEADAVAAEGGTAADVAAVQWSLATGPLAGAGGIVLQEVVVAECSAGGPGATSCSLTGGCSKTCSPGEGYACCNQGDCSCVGGGVQ